MNLKELYKQYESYRISHPLYSANGVLNDSVNYMLEIGGKRVRPLLVLSAGISLKSNIESLLPIAHAIEVFHNFTLVHDDIMDKSQKRRGKATVHIQWDEPTAILAGDFLLIESVKYITQSGINHFPDIIQMFLKTASEVCEGQMDDMELGKIIETTPENYLEMIRKKTAVLLACSLCAGALVAQADDIEADLYYQLGIALGMEFQLMDDYLDSFGTEALIGKKVGGDILEGKNTWLKIQSHKLDAKKNAELFGLDNSTEKIQQIISYWKTLGLDKSLLVLASKYSEESKNIIDKLEFKGKNCDLLKELIEELSVRVS